MKGKLEILVGISGSGKSTYAHSELLNDIENVTLVNRDKIRELLFGFTESSMEDYYKLKNLNSLEKKVTQYEDTLINEALCKGNRTIVDATHLDRKYIERFRFWNVPTEIKVFPIILGLAIKRVRERNRKVSDEIVIKQYEKFVNLTRNLKKDPIDFTPVTFYNDNSKPPAVIFDIDGSLAHMNGGRSPFDWLKVGQDSLDTNLYNTLITYKGKMEVIICTGRDGESLDETEKWLYNNNITYNQIYIRDKGDSRPDWVVKEEMWRKISENFYINSLYDDRLQVCRRSRSLGLKTYNVEYHNF